MIIPKKIEIEEKKLILHKNTLGITDVFSDL